MLSLPACVSAGASTTVAPLPTPTLHPIFSNQQNGLAEEAAATASFSSDIETRNAVQQSSPTTGISQTIPPSQAEVLSEITLSLYDDSLNPDWGLNNSQSFKYDPSQIRVRYTGEKAVMATPQGDFGRLFFTVSPQAVIQYEREQLLGLSFWLSGGDQAIGFGDLAVTITGSNTLPYWQDGDVSVPFPEGMDYFSETALYDLGFNREIPAGSWVEVIVWLDELIYDPATYRYVTGFYIKNDAGVSQPFFVDDISLILAAKVN